MYVTGARRYPYLLRVLIFNDGPQFPISWWVFRVPTSAINKIIPWVGVSSSAYSYRTSRDFFLDKVMITGSAKAGELHFNIDSNIR